MNTEVNIENLTIIITVDQGTLKVLFHKRQEEPYKGYWAFPSKTLEAGEEFFTNTEAVLDELFHLTNVSKETFKAFQYSLNDEKILQVTTLCYMDSATRNYMIENTEKYELEWFDISNLPKVAFNYAEIINEVFTYLKIKIQETDLLKTLYPSDFTVAELHTLVEQVTEKELDRNSFRNRLVSAGIIDDTDQTDIASSGRPAKLYQFKEDACISRIF